MVYVFLADGFEEMEAIVPVDFLRRLKIDVKTVGVTGKTVTGSHNVAVDTDILLDEVDIENAQMLVLPGGMPGTDNLEKSEKLSKLLDIAFEKKIFISAICAAPKILGKKGFLNEKEAVCYPGYENDLLGAIISNEEVVVSDNIITANGAGNALKFALRLGEVLTDIKTVREASKNMMCK